MKYYLGVDGGGSKTTAIASDEKGNIIALAQGKTINYYSNPFETTRENFRELVEKIGISDYASVCIGMSALSDRADEKTARKFTDGIINADRLIMTSDVEIALNAAECQTARAVLICGTGSMAAAVDECGNYLHAGGWGYLLGDEGSGYSVALNAVKKILVELEKNSDDLLISEFKKFFKVETEDDILERFYNPPIQRDVLASFCKTVFDAYRNGSEIAAAVIENEACEAAELSKRILSKLPPDSPLFLFGGVFENNPEYIKLLNEKISVKAELLTYPPVVGALTDALKNDGIIPDEEIYLNIKRSSKND